MQYGIALTVTIFYIKLTKFISELYLNIYVFSFNNRKSDGT